MRADRFPAAAVLLAVLACSEPRHVCKTQLTDQRHGTAVEAVGVGPSDADARADGRVAACRDLGRLSPAAEALVSECERWRLEQERTLPTQEKQIEIWHVCSWASMDLEEPPFATAADEHERRLNEEAKAWRERLRGIRDAYLATCTADDARFAVAHDCVKKGWIDDLAGGCAAQSAH